ncbi:hypothetical protein EBT16_07205 [bacterium]|nr:hypothetical protein [bacterium]
MRSIESKVIQQHQLEPLCESIRKSGKTLVTTNGCFDILHWGHLQYLEKARELGDVLICAVNSDASVRKLKGPSRPIHPEGIRAKQLAALESVELKNNLIEKLVNLKFEMELNKKFEKL